jgi:hypothetical protein
MIELGRHPIQRFVKHEVLECYMKSLLSLRMYGDIGGVGMAWLVAAGHKGEENTLKRAGGKGGMNEIYYFTTIILKEMNCTAG